MNSNKVEKLEKQNTKDFFNLTTLKSSLHSRKPQNSTHKPRSSKTIHRDSRVYDSIFPFIDKPVRVRSNSLRKIIDLPKSRLSTNDDIKNHHTSLNLRSTIEQQMKLDVLSTRKPDMHKFKQQQRNQIYALNNLMTSLEYENFIAFCKDNGIEIKSKV